MNRLLILNLFLPPKHCFGKKLLKLSLILFKKKNQTWELVDLPLGAKIIGYKWIFKRKYFPNGFIEKYKVRLVAKGFSYKQNIDYFDNFAHVTRVSSIRILIVLASTHKLFIHQIDVKTEFLNGDLKEEMYMYYLKSVLYKDKNMKFANSASLYMV